MSATPPQQPEDRIEVDDSDGNDADLCLDDESTTSTSLNSSAQEYENRHSRRYHGYDSGSYRFPNDTKEQKRLDMVHHSFFRLFNDRLLLAPIDLTGKRVLDIGTGTGLWAIQLGDQFPEAELILGNDVNPVPPSWSPPNVKITMDDVEELWIESETYDYIHCRYMAGSIKDWPRLFKQIYNNLSPGGYVEFQESDNVLVSEDGTLTDDNAIVKMIAGLMDACDKIGRNMNPAPSFEGWAKDTGFENVVKQVFKLPVGTWAKDMRLKECGLYARHSFLEGFQGFTAQLFTGVLGWTREEVESLNVGVRAAAKDNTVHALFNVIVVTAQKPGKAE